MILVDHTHLHGCGVTAARNVRAWVEVRGDRHDQGDGRAPKHPAAATRRPEFADAGNGGRTPTVPSDTDLLNRPAATRWTGVPALSARPERGRISPLTQGELNMDTDQGAPHRRVLDGVLADIRSGRYPPGGRLPSGSALGEEYGVYRSAASRAVELLRWIGLVIGPPGGIARVASEPHRSSALELVARADELRAAQEKNAGGPSSRG